MSMINRRLFDKPLILVNGSMNNKLINALDIQCFDKINHFDIESGFFESVKMHIINQAYEEIERSQNYREIMAEKKKQNSHCIIVKEYIPAIYNIFRTKPYYHLFKEVN
jgi:hypothetical protein